MSEHTYSKIDIGSSDIVIQCSDCGAYVINKPESEVKHCKTCIPGDAERWRQHYSQPDPVIDGEEEEYHAPQRELPHVTTTALSSMAGRFNRGLARRIKKAGFFRNPYTSCD